MSTYGFSNAELGLTFRSPQERRTNHDGPNIMQSLPAGETELEKKYGVNLKSLKKYVAEHLLVDVEKTVLKGSFTYKEIDKMYQYCREETEAIERLTPETIEEDDLIWLIQKANSYSDELHDLEHGNHYDSPKPEVIAVVERVRQYTGPENG